MLFLSSFGMSIDARCRDNAFKLVLFILHSLPSQPPFDTPPPLMLPASGGGLGSWEGPVLGAALRVIGHERDRLLAFECHRAARMVYEEAQDAAAERRGGGQGGGGRGGSAATCSVVAVVGAAHAAGMEVMGLHWKEKKRRRRNGLLLPCLSSFFSLHYLENYSLCP